ncbi:MAG TPA: ImmA/IrrE family metallo-endopeptidase [Treponemataceae bacterium]|nr:ImmA/IrrE family metallo-endopeptidase [Treponemataceae bacterium]
MAEYFKSKCPYIAKEILWERVEIFRQQFDNCELYPVDVELLTELAGYEIIPKKDLDDFDAFLSMNVKSIIVNARRYDNPSYSRRVRFSIAHELGHAILHSNFIKQQHIESIADYTKFIRSLSDEEYSDFEWQANEFAGRLLVPREQLIVDLHIQIKLIVDQGLEEILFNNPDLVRSRLCIPIAKVFEVSEDVIERRLEREGLWPVDLE